MMITLLTLAILVGSLLMALGGLRMVLQDTYATLSAAAMRAHKSGELIPRASFAMLWLLIFALCYM
ncbi:hypothetical protein [Tropicibacter oceani]|uniref:Uncharacterized protein n=1 Tax=Tropicibacter oceani TaxID=3058420 RepID=A0ABY8QLK4_9RHOB|nr:hypothetical protein [Tropicibacter oceani]WGW05338.1 hypothetical protein QF118_07265 [Tropicibacter oceani]